MIATYGNGPTLSPRELARALGVSESSIKRWVDAGRVPARRTTGGHRRIELADALRFVMDSGHEIADPNALGLPTLLPDGATSIGERLAQLIEDGGVDELTRTALMLLATRKMKVAELFDGPLREGMSRVGALWQGGTAGIFEERRATQMLLALTERIDTLYPLPERGPVAIGGSISGDTSTLPSRMAATVLTSEGVRPVYLGPDIPAAVFLEAVEAVRAKIVFLSATYVKDVPQLSSEFGQVLELLSNRGVYCIIGGQAANRLQLPERDRIVRTSNMAGFAALAQKLRCR